MSYARLLPVLVSKSLPSTEEFYVGVLDFELVTRTGWYLELKSRTNDSVRLAFVSANFDLSHPSYRPPYSGSGLTYEFIVDDIEGERERVEKRQPGLPSDIYGEPWGQRFFTLPDPNGVNLRITDRGLSEGDFERLYPNGTPR